MEFLILSQLSVGIILILLTIPLERVGRGFFSFHAGLALALQIIAVALVRSKAMLFAPYLVALAALSTIFAVRKLRWSKAVLIAAGALGVCALAIDVVRSGGLFVNVAGALVIVSSALVLGSIVVTMNLGHWYLVIRGLPFDLLGTANRTFVYSLLARLAAIAVGAVAAADAWKALWTPAAGPIWDTAIFLTVRVMFGLAAPLLLSWMVHECVKIKSNQSATGILYVSLVFVLIGELSGLYFFVQRGVPL